MLRILFDSGLSMPLIIINLCIFIITLAVSLSAHEFMHGWSAYKCGDPTAKSQGRLSLNPMVHLDPMGTIMMLLAGFGWAKPVMINPNKLTRFKNRNVSLRIVSLAGVSANFVLAFIAYLLYAVVLLFCYFQDIDVSVDYLFRLSGNYPPISFACSILCTFLISLFERNLMLLAFNLLPIPPLDGFNFVDTFLPTKIRYKIQSLSRYTSYIFLALMIFGRNSGFNILGELIYRIMIPFQYVIIKPIDELFRLLLL